MSQMHVVGLINLTMRSCIVCILVSEISSERNETASQRPAQQTGFWEDPKRMRPLGTQRPERPKSELWHKKYEKCDLSKALRRGMRMHGRPPAPPAATEKGRETSTGGGWESPTIRSVVPLEYVARFVLFTYP